MPLPRNILVYTDRGESREGLHGTRSTPKVIDLCVIVKAFISVVISLKMNRLNLY